MRNGLVKKKVKIVLQKVELGCQNILLNHWFAATKKCQMCIFILSSTQHGATLDQDHVLQDALKRQKEECKEWTSHSNRYNKKIEQKIIALITLGVPIRTIILPRHVKSKQPSLWRHPPTKPQAASPRQGPCALLGEEQEQVLRGLFIFLNEMFPNFDKVL